jgi:CHAD domain-containing protein
MAYTYIIKNTSAQHADQLLNRLKTNFTLIRESRQQGTYHYFDTFDWRLYRQGYHLYLFNQILYLYQFSKGIFEEKEDFRSPFTETLILKDGNILRKISRIIDVRVLLCMASIRIMNQSFRILNKDDKTIVRIQLEQSKIKDKTRYKYLSSFLEIKPIRGYAHQVPGILKKLPSGDLIACKDDLLKRGLATLDRIPIDYSSKIDIRLTKRMSAFDATKQIYIYLLEIIRKNENGIVKDLDTEFLHDFRVAIRRTRSALGQIKGILDENVVIKVKEYFSYLGKSTNKLRDIDVYLLREQQYKLMVPVELKQYLKPFFKALAEQRKIEHQSLIKLIKSAKYKRMLSEWESYLNSKEVRNHQKSGSVRELAGNVIIKRNKKVLDFGQKIILTGSDDLLHQLRIEGKKLRYLLEFFQSLYPLEKIQFLIKKLKLLQDNLGELNDLVIQQRRLIDSAREISPATRGEKNTVLTLGILIGKLNEKQLIIKREFSKLFSNYADSEVQTIYDDLFQLHRRHIR